jgi:hypothetical protein
MMVSSLRGPHENSDSPRIISVVGTMEKRSLFLSLMAVLILTTPAYAYLDPGTGSILLQALIGGIAASVTVVSMYYQRIKAFFAGQSASKESNEK